MTCYITCYRDQKEIQLVTDKSRVRCTVMEIQFSGGNARSEGREGREEGEKSERARRNNYPAAAALLRCSKTFDENMGEISGGRARAGEPQPKRRAAVSAGTDYVMTYGIT